MRPGTSCARPPCATGRPSQVAQPTLHPSSQLGALPPDSLLLAYSYVAVMFGLSFPSPDELGSSAAAASRVPHLAALGGADLAVRQSTACVLLLCGWCASLHSCSAVVQELSWC